MEFHSLNIFEFGENKRQEVSFPQSYCINYIKCIFWNKFIFSIFIYKAMFHI